MTTENTAGELYWGELGRDGFIDQVWLEIKRAADKHGWDKTPFNPDMPMADKFVILVEEVGEVLELLPEDSVAHKRLGAALGRVARALTYDEGDEHKLREELVQVAAMASLMAMSLKI